MRPPSERYRRAAERASALRDPPPVDPDTLDEVIGALTEVAGRHLRGCKVDVGRLAAEQAEAVLAVLAGR